MGTPQGGRHARRPTAHLFPKSDDENRNELARYLRAAFIHFHDEVPTFRRALNRVRRENADDAWRAVADAAVAASRKRLFDAAHALESYHSGTMEHQKVERSRFEQTMQEDPEGNGLACYLHAAFCAYEGRGWGFDRILKYTSEDPGEPWRRVAQMARSAALTKRIIQ
jgi:hypothetical protein